MKNKSFLREISWVLLFKFLIDLIYGIFLSKDFAYSGLILIFNPIKFIESLLAIILSYKLLKKNECNSLFFSLFVIFLILIIPTTTIYALRDESRFFFYIIIFGFNLFLWLVGGKSIAIRNIKGVGKIPIFISIVLTLLVVLHYLKTKGFSAINFNFYRVYEFRDKYGEMDNEGIFGYLNSWVSKVLNVMLIIWSFQKRNWFLLLVFLMTQITLFGLSGHKSVLLTLFPLIFLYLFRNKDLKSYMLKGGAALFFLVTLYTYFTNDISIVSLVIRRALIVPAHLNFDYYNFFSNHKFVYWSNSIFSYFSDYPFSENPPLMIGASLGRPEMYANTGLFGSGYMHFGIFGILIYIFLVAIFVVFLNSLKHMPPWILNGIILIPLLTLFYGSDLLTGFLTHGFLPAVFFLYLYNQNFKLETKIPS